MANQPQVMPSFDQPFAESVSMPNQASGGWIHAVQQQLGAIENLPANWDLQGASPPDARMVRAGLNLLRIIRQTTAAPQPQVHPTPSGGVQFEWESDGRYFEIEVTDSDTAQYFFEDRGAGECGEGTLCIR